MEFPFALDPSSILVALGTWWGLGALLGSVIVLLSAGYRRG